MPRAPFCPGPRSLQSDAASLRSAPVLNSFLAFSQVLSVFSLSTRLVQNSPVRSAEPVELLLTIFNHESQPIETLSGSKYEYTLALYLAYEGEPFRSTYCSTDTPDS